MGGSIGITAATLAMLAACGIAGAQGAAHFCWQEPQAVVLPTGDLKPVPEPFEFRARRVNPLH